MIFNCLLDNVGNTPLISIHLTDLENIALYAKLEYLNPTGSVKDRAASYIIKYLLNTNKINGKDTIIESSSGNFGIALSAYCRKYGLKFIGIIDPTISPINEMLMHSFGATLIKVDVLDENGGYLLNRIRKVKELMSKNENLYWVNQYENPLNAQAYYDTLGQEICNDLNKIDHIFIGVSSGGTITGVSRKIKEKFPNAKVIAVDIVGSVIFGGCPKKRYISGIGSSMVPGILKSAKIDDVVWMDEVETIKSCHELMHKYSIFAGGSSGSVFGAIKKYFAGQKLNEKISIVTVFPDRGERYSHTVYNEKWYLDFIKKRTGDNFNNIV